MKKIFVAVIAGVFTVAISSCEGGLSPTQPDAKVQAAGPGWVITQTSVSHGIIIPLLIHQTINGVPLTDGDYIGVFFRDNGIEEPGGFTPWTGKDDYGIAAWGNDASPGNPKNGFSDNEQILWKVWRKSDGKTFNATVTYYNIGDSLWRADGVSVITSLKGEGE